MKGTVSMKENERHEIIQAETPPLLLTRGPRPSSWTAALRQQALWPLPPARLRSAYAGPGSAPTP